MSVCGQGLHTRNSLIVTYRTPYRFGIAQELAPVATLNSKSVLSYSTLSASLLVILAQAVLPAVPDTPASASGECVIKADAAGGAEAQTSGASVQDGRQTGRQTDS